MTNEQFESICRLTHDLIVERMGYVNHLCIENAAPALLHKLLLSAKAVPEKLKIGSDEHRSIVDLIMRHDGCVL